jgi:hypothetical protein
MADGWNAVTSDDDDPDTQIIDPLPKGLRQWAAVTGTSDSLTAILPLTPLSGAPIIVIAAIEGDGNYTNYTDSGDFTGSGVVTGGFVMDTVVGLSPGWMAQQVGWPTGDDSYPDSIGDGWIANYVTLYGGEGRFWTGHWQGPVAPARMVVLELGVGSPFYVLPLSGDIGGTNTDSF